MKELWTEKYRPNKTKDYVFRDDAQKYQVESWIKEGAIPHLLFSGPPGTGKTTLAKLLLHELDVDSMDILEINASRERGVGSSTGNVDNKIVNFVALMPFGEFKYVLLDEVDYMTPAAQVQLRGVMETYASTARFILTCNYPHRIIEPLHSRCQGFHIQKLDVTEFTARLAQICIDESVQMDLDTLDTYVQASYPDLRKCINLVQQNVVDGVLRKPHESEVSDTSDWMLSAIELFKSGEYTAARKLIVEKARPEEYEDIYKFMYRNLNLWGDTESKRDQAIIIIRDGLVKSVSCADPEINLCATLIELQINSS